MKRPPWTFWPPLVRRSFKPQNGRHLTIHSAVYNLTQKIVYWVPNENYEDPAAWFSFAL